MTRPSACYAAERFGIYQFTGKERDSESALDEFAYLLDPNAPRGENQGEARRQLLANLAAPFLSRNLNEWSDDGKSFVNGVFKRLHPQGAHPGLSDEEDSTFRLHLVLLVSRLFLRRLDPLVPLRQIEK